jgi:hypothetical protein
MEDLDILVHGAALQYLSVFLDPNFTVEKRRERLMEMKPQDGDVEKVFRPPLLEPARALYRAMWSNPPPLSGKPDQTVVWVRTARTEDFVEWNRTGYEFPGGYRKLAPHLQPGLIWVAWKFVAKGEITGLSFDGLVWLEKRFVWFPQPWRLVPM